MGFEKAKREQVWLKILLSGASGSGKSYSALELATGIAEKCDSDIAYIGTEGSRDKYYAEQFDYDLLQLSEPFSVDKYMSAIDEAVRGGYKVLIIDSLSMEWKWLNSEHDKMGGNSFQNWAKLKPRHQKLMDKILLSPIHVISTARGKDEWVLEEQNNKKVPKKVGLGSQQDKDITYIHTVSFVIDQSNHVATADKDNTGLFDQVYKVLDKTDGYLLWQWANEGEKVKEPTKKELKSYETASMTLEEAQSEIIKNCKNMGGQSNEELMNVLKQHTTNGNPKQIKDLTIAIDVLNQIKELNYSMNESVE